MRRLELRRSIPILESLGFLEALGENRVLKHLQLHVNCSSRDVSLDNTMARSLSEAIGNLVGWETVTLKLRLYDEEALRQIYFILSNGLARNKTIKEFHICVSRIFRISKNEHNIKRWVSEEVNKSLSFALPHSSSPWPSNTSTTAGSVLQEFSFALKYCRSKPLFRVHVNPDTEFWLSLKKAGIPKLLQQPDEFQSWRDAIIESSGNPSIVYYLLRQKPGLLTKSVLVERMRANSE